MFKRFILLSIFLVLLIACTGAAGDAGVIVEQYMEAKVDGDTDTIQQLLCSEMEEFMEREALTFAAVEGARIENMSCQQVGDTDTVTCEGEIIAMYGTEENVFPLTSYRVVQEDGEWRWCGETY
ncbi:MAG: nuclear transport factor 2 family protein [Anaerolineales bacterium]|nr:nuclear transport factor 2 family protein [Anaerolineales bacterium]